MSNDVLALRAVLGVAVSVKVVLTDIESSNRCGFVCGCDSFNRFVLYGFMSRWCVVFPGCRQHLFDPVYGPL